MVLARTHLLCDMYVTAYRLGRQRCNRHRMWLPRSRNLVSSTVQDEREPHLGPLGLYAAIHRN